MAGISSINLPNNTTFKLRDTRFCGYYGTCATGASSASKTVTLLETGTITLEPGLTVRVKFTNSNTASSPTLSVNGSGAKSIKRYGDTAPSTTPQTSWNAGSVIEFVYDGTYWQMVGWINDGASYSPATTTTDGLMSSTDKGTLDNVSSFTSLSSLTGNEYVVFVDGTTTKKIALSSLISYVISQAAGSFVEVSHPNSN